MAKHCYNTFLVADCKTGRSILVTSSARKARTALCKGRRVEVWNSNEKVEVIYDSIRHELQPYIDAERDFLRQKQNSAEQRNERRKAKQENRMIRQTFMESCHG